MAATTVLDTISRALRICKVLGAGRTPKAPDAAFGLEAFNDLVLHLDGYGAAHPMLDAVANAAETVSRDDPAARRLCKTSGGAFTVTLPSLPRDGARFAVVDVDRTFDTQALTVDGAGMRFDATLDSEGLPSGGSTSTTVLATQGLNRAWMFRADLGAWIPIGELALNSPMPYPKDYDQSFAFMLAALVSPEYGVGLDAVQLRHADIGYQRLAARYVEPLPSYCDRALLARRRGSVGIANV